MNLDLPSGARVVVAMSGGVDSSVAAALLVAAGHAVVGVTLQLYDQGQAVGRDRACCAGQDIQDARRVAERLGIAHYVLDYEARFRRAVIEPFADSYAAGETPVPCVLCNQRVKFRDLLQTARDLGATALATGHYVRRIQTASGVELHRGREAARDQSYFLFATTAEELAFLRFPVGDLAKGEVRRIAAKHGLAIAEKPDSQDICFVPTRDYAEVLTKLRPDAAEPGEIVDLDGRVLGRHAGVLHFTVGQRRGLRLAGAEPLYVVRLEAAARRVVVGPRAALGRDRVALRGLNWLAPAGAAPRGESVTVKLRSAQADTPARISAGTDGAAVVDLEAPAFGVAPGQACVAYRGSRVLGGGWIAATAQRSPQAARH